MKDGTFIQMFFHRMATKPPVAILLWAIILSTITSLPGARASFELADDIKRFVPECAWDCVVAFLDGNFPDVSCGDDDEVSLGCICPERGGGGFTVGEVAYQCMDISQQAGLCSEDEAGGSAANQAYFMCDDAPVAVQPTHTILAATFVVSRGPGTSVTIIPPTGLPLPPSSTPTTLIRPSSPTSTPTDTSGATPTASPPLGGDDEDSSGLSTPQIIGMSVGIGVGLAVVLAIFCMARRKRKARLSELGPGEAGMMPEKGVSGFGVGGDRPPNRGDHGQIFHISSPVHHHASPPMPPDAFTRENSRSDAVIAATAAAVPPPRSQAATMSPRGTPPPPPYMQRRHSKLLPPKPDRSSKPMLTLTIPNIDLNWSPPRRVEQAQAEAQAQAQSRAEAAKLSNLTSAPRPRLNLARESTMTEFEEDGTTHPSVSTRVASQIWWPPTADPTSATTYYVADKNGNWVLGDPFLRDQQGELCELEAPTPLSAQAQEKAMKAQVPNAEVVSRAGIGHGAGSSPIAPSMPSEPPKAVTAPAQVTLLPAAQIRPAQSASAIPVRGPVIGSAASSYSRSGSSRPSRPAPPSSATHNVPPMSFSHPAPPQSRSDSTGSRRSQRRVPGSQDQPNRPFSQQSRQSTTTIASSAAGFDDDEGVPVPEQRFLSPVVESPASGVAEVRNPITYPRMRVNLPNLQLNPLATRIGPVSPPGQSSPTLGTMPAPAAATKTLRQMAMANAVHRNPEHRRVPSQQQQSQTQAQGPPSGFRRPDPSQFKTGSPTMRIVPPSRSPSTSPYPEPLQPHRARVAVEDLSSVVPAPLRGLGVQQNMPSQQSAEQKQDRGYDSPRQAEIAEVHQDVWGNAPVHQASPEGQHRRHQHHWHPQQDMYLQKQQIQQQQQQSQQQQQRQRQVESLHDPFQPRQPPPPPSSQQQQQQQPQQRQYVAPPPQPQPRYQYQQEHHQQHAQLHPQQHQPQPRPRLRYPPHLGHATQSSGSSSMSSSSTSSLLAAKRLGSERAATLALQHSQVSRDGRWRREDIGARGFVPRPGPGARPDQNPHPRPPAMPQPPPTPGWQPKLTPTRRGDDLFIDVQGYN